jgi:CBS domain containing-hemolysin-like protein
LDAWLALLLFTILAALASFYGAAIIALSALERFLEERGRDREPPNLTAFILRDAPAAATAWLLGGVVLGLGAGLCLGQATTASTAAGLGVRLGSTAIACAAALAAGLLAWKRLAETAPGPYCAVAATLVLPFYLLLYPVRRPLSAALQRFYPPLTLRAGVLFTDDVKEIAEGEEHSHLLERGEREMITRVFELGETVVREIMVPRIDMVAVEESTAIPDLVRLIQTEGHSRFPVYRDSIDNVVGFLYIKDLIAHVDRLATVRLHDLVRPAYFVPETKRVDELLAEMRSRRLYLAIVVDEYGGTAGLVTMEDVIEEVVGEIHDELDEEQPLVSPQDDGSYRVDAKVDLDDLNELLHVALPADEYDTLGGFLYALAGKIPGPGDRFEHDGLEFTIGSVRGKRINQVQVRSLRSQTVDEAGAEREDDRT